MFKTFTLMLIPCLVADPTRAGIFSAPTRSSLTALSQEPFQREALVAVLAGTAFAGGHIIDSAPFSQMVHWAGALQLGVILAIAHGKSRPRKKEPGPLLDIIMQLEPPSKQKSEPTGKSNLRSEQELAQARVVLVSVLSVMQQEAQMKFDEAEQVVKQSKNNIKKPDLGHRDSALTYLGLVDDLLQIALNSRVPLNLITHNLRVLKPTEAAARLRKDPRTHFIEELILRLDHPEIIPAERKRHHILIEHLLARLWEIHLDDFSLHGLVLDAYIAATIKSLNLGQPKALGNALIHGDDRFGRGLIPADAEGELRELGSHYDLEKDAKALLRFMLIFGREKEQFKDAGIILLLAHLFAPPVLSYLMPPYFRDTRRFLEEQPARMLTDEERSHLRTHLVDDVHLEIRDEDKVLQMLPRLSWNFHAKPKVNVSRLKVKTRNRSWVFKSRGISILPILAGGALVSLFAVTLPPLFRVPEIATAAVMVGTVGLSMGLGSLISWLGLEAILFFMKPRSIPPSSPPGKLRRLWAAA